MPSEEEKTGEQASTLQATAGKPAAAQKLRYEWPGPSLDSDQNRGYALQWFSFSAIAVIAALFLMYRMLRPGARNGKQ